MVGPLKDKEKMNAKDIESGGVCGRKGDLSTL